VFLETSQPLRSRLTEDDIFALEKDEDEMNEQMGHWKGGNQKLRKVVQTVKNLNVFKNIASTMTSVACLYRAKQRAAQSSHL
jgi:hypothetical protein